MKQLFPLVFIVLLFVVMNRQQRKRAQAVTVLQKFFQHLNQCELG